MFSFNYVISLICSFCFCILILVSCFVDSYASAWNKDTGSGFLELTYNLSASNAEYIIDYRKISFSEDVGIFNKNEFGVYLEYGVTPNIMLSTSFNSSSLKIVSDSTVNCSSICVHNVDYLKGNVSVQYQIMKNSDNVIAANVFYSKQMMSTAYLPEFAYDDSSDSAGLGLIVGRSIRTVSADGSLEDGYFTQFSVIAENNFDSFYNNLKVGFVVGLMYRSGFIAIAEIWHHLNIDNNLNILDVDNSASYDPWIDNMTSDNNSYLLSGNVRIAFSTVKKIHEQFYLKTTLYAVSAVTDSVGISFSIWHFFGN